MDQELVMTKILALSAKKQGGKSTSMNFLHGIQMTSHGIIEGFRVNNHGKLQVPFLYDEDTDKARIEYGLFDITRDDPGFLNYMAENVHPYVKCYSLAAPLKRFCINVLGLKPEQCYGTDEQKNSLTDLRWEDMPGVVTVKPVDLAWSMTEGHTEQKHTVDTIVGRLGKYYDKIDGVVYHEPGFMTAREVMQFFGTEVCRGIKDSCWVDACVREIKADGVELAIIDDCRFPNEVEGLQAHGAKVIRLTRKGTSDNDQHRSETALDKENFDWNKFDFIIDNQNMTIGQQNEAVFKYLKSVGFIDADFNVNAEALV